MQQNREQITTTQKEYRRELGSLNTLIKGLEEYAKKQA